MYVTYVTYATYVTYVRYVTYVTYVTSLGSPAEDFTTFLGSDASIKLEHQPLARERKAGTWRSATQSTTHKYLIKVHNTKPVAARLTVVEVLPKSTEDKIKV